MADLRSLINAPKADAEATPHSQSKSLRARIAAAWPLLLLLAFLLFLWMLFGDHLARATPVELAPVITLPAVETEAAATTPDSATTTNRAFDEAVRFQASGWIEAEPYPIRASTLIDGTIDTVRVLEGDHVTRGQVLATLVDADAALDRATAQASLRQSEARLEAARARADSAAARIATLDLEVAAARARLAELRDDAERLIKIGSDAAPAGDISQARLRVSSQQAAIKALESRRPELVAEQRARHAEAREADDTVAHAQTELARRELAMERTRISSPIDGIVQSLHAAPGMKRMLSMDDPESATIAKIYNPEKLQARIDVPLEAAAQLAIGQAVRIRSSLLPDRKFQGRIRQIEGQADIQRNTLQVKVTLLDPDPRLRPEMLCRAEFLETPSAAGDATNQNRSQGLALYVPEAALVSDGDGPAVWKVDASGDHIIRQAIRTSGDPREGHREVREGLLPGDRVVLNPTSDLEAGERIKPLSR